MKKLLSLALCLIMLLSVALMSCDNTDNQTNETSAESTSAQTTSEDTTSESTSKETTAPAIPDGYQAYNDGYIYFVYPGTWSKNSGSVVTLGKANESNNITVVYEDKTDYYEKMTTAIFKSEMKPVYESMGMTLSGEKVEQTTNNSGTKITKVSYTAIVNGVSMQQTAYALTVGNRTYTVTVTEVTPDTELVNNVFNSLAKLK